MGYLTIANGKQNWNRKLSITSTQKTGKDIAEQTSFEMKMNESFLIWMAERLSLIMAEKKARAHTYTHTKK